MTQTLRFSRIHLENWRNFVRTQAELERRIFLVGPNASGKSNFLDVFRFLHDLVSVGGGLEEAVRKRGGLSRLRCLAARNPSDVVVEVSLGNGDAARVWEYELRLTQDKKERPLIKRERVAFNGSNLFTRPDSEDKADTERLTQTYLQQVNVNRQFRAVADFFASVRYLHIVPQLVREPDRSAGRRNDPYGGDFLEQVARTSDKPLKARLRRIQNALKVAVPQRAGRYPKIRPVRNAQAQTTLPAFVDRFRLIGFLALASVPLALRFSRASRAGPAGTAR